MNKDNVLCPLPFVHSFFDVRGFYFACCNAVDVKYDAKHVSQISAKEWFYSDEMNALRSDMISGVRNPMCNHCWKKDDIGITSPRFNHINQWKGKIDYTNPKPMYFDLKPSNHCNLACIFCTASSSDKILKITESLPKEQKPQRWASSVENVYKREKIFGSSFDSSVVDYIKNNIKDLELLKFTGGEPFLSKEVLDILSLVSEIKPEVEIKITTNGTVIIKDFYKVLKKMKKTSVKFSIDAVDELYDYIRFPSKWSQFQKRIENAITNLPEVSFNVNCLISNMNLEQLPKIRNWYKSLEKKHKNLTYIIFDPNLGPMDNESSLYVVPPRFLEQVRDFLKIETADWDMDCKTDQQILNVFKKIDDAIKNNLYSNQMRNNIAQEFIKQNTIRKLNVHDVVEPISADFFKGLL